MPTFNTEFKRDPVNFTSTYAVAINYGAHGPGIQNFLFEREDDDDPMVLRSAQQGDTDVFKAYFLPYADNTTFTLQLGNGADYLFTPPMTGCSFFIDSAWWSPEVAHINYQTPQGGIDQPRIDQDPAAVRLVNRGYAVKKADYVPNGQSSQDNRLVVFGVRGRLGWYLYRTKHDITSGTVTEPPSRIN